MISGGVEATEAELAQVLTVYDDAALVKRYAAVVFLYYLAPESLIRSFSVTTNFHEETSMVDAAVKVLLYRFVIRLFGEFRVAFQLSSTDQYFEDTTPKLDKNRIYGR